MFRLTARKHQAFLDRSQSFASCKMSSSSRSDVCGKSSGSETLQKTSERSRQNYWNQFRNDTHPLPLWIMYDPQRKRRILIIIILMLILLAFTNMFSELLNVEFLSNLYQLFLFHYLSSALVAEFIIYFVLLIYRMILALICSMIFAAARVLLTKHLLETMSSITTTQLRTS